MYYMYFLLCIRHTMMYCILTIVRASGAWLRATQVHKVSEGADAKPSTVQDTQRSCVRSAYERH